MNTLLRSRRLWIPLAGVIVLAVLTLRAGWLAGTPARGTATAVAAEHTAPAAIRAEGRLAAYPGADVTLGTDLDGTVAQVLVTEQQPVRRGQLLVQLESDEYAAALAESKARAAEAEADYKLALVEVERAVRLVQADVGTTQARDRAERDRDAALARIEAARAAERRIEAILKKTRIVSPIDGIVLQRFVDKGEAVAAGSPLVQVADLSRTRIESEVDEYDAGRIAVGAGVVVSAEGFSETWKGRVEEIPSQVTGRRLKPEDPGRPSDTRVLLVKITLDETAHLKLGQRVEVSIEPRGAKQD
jgi:RND family efflux transporter MFP subunit